MTPARITRTGSFTLPCEPRTAIPLFTPEGERAWVEGWAPVYLSEATDEVGAVWITSTHAPTTWVTVTRTDDRVAYARVSENGTAGMVEVHCVAAPGGTTVHVRYDLTATNAAGSTWLEHFSAGYDDMLEEWRNLTLRLIEKTRPRSDP